MALDKRDSETPLESPWKFHALRREDAVTARSFTPRMARAVASMLTGRRKSSMPVALRTPILERMDVPTCVQLPTCDAEGECANDDEVKCLGQNWRRLRHQLRRGALGEATAAQTTSATAASDRINQVLTACSCCRPAHVPGRRGRIRTRPQFHVSGARDVGEGSGTVGHGTEQLATTPTGAALVGEGAGFESRPTGVKCVLETSTDVIKE